MYILRNYRQNAPFKVSRRNNLIVIENTNASVMHRAIEARQPVQYFCIPREAPGAGMARSALIPAKLFFVETIFEQPEPTLHEATYDMLVNDFGDRGSRERIKKREFATSMRPRAVQFNIGNQILPNYDREAEDPKEAYSLDLLFSQPVLHEFGQAEVELGDLCSPVKKCYSEDKREPCIAADCLYKILETKNVREQDLPVYCRTLYREVKTEMARGRMSPLLRDKLTVKFYILLLIINNYEMVYEQIPKFDTPKSKVVGLLKAIGCNVGASGLVALVRLPDETMSVK